MAYDNYNQAVDCDGHDSWDDESVLEPTAAAPPQKAVQDTPDDDEPPRKKAKEDSGVLNSMAKVVNKPQQDGENLDTELSELVKQLLSKGVSKDARDELLDKFPTPGNCTRLQVVRVNPEIFKSVKRDQNGGHDAPESPKTLLKGIIAVTRLLDDYMKAEKGQKPLPTMEAVTKIV